MKNRILTVALVLGAAASSNAEPMFLSRQYTRCANCHVSPSGGGLLTMYGRSLSKVELSTMKGSPTSREHEFLFGALEKMPESFHLGATFRPARLDVDFRGGSISRNFVMNVDLVAAFQKNGWTVYAELGRQGRTAGAEVDSYDHWVSYRSEKGLGVRVGRFMPAYGVKFPDHTTFTRRSLGFDTHDQVYGVELSHTSENRLFQVSAGPGRATSLVDDDGLAAFTLTGRGQFDLGGSRVLVVSGAHRAEADRARAQTMGGAAFGFSPAKRWSIWTEGDARKIDGTDGASYTLANETSFEAHRGVWLKFTPQLRTNPGDTSGGVLRLGAAIDWLARTHWNVVVLYYRDKDRRSDSVTKTFLAQLHLYL